VRNAALFGDPTAMRLILKSQGYLPKPIAAFLDHPLFSFAGLLHFLDGLCRNFWRGMFTWNGELMAHPWADAVYVATSAAFLVAATLAIARGISRWHRSRQRDLPAELRTDLAAWLTVVGAVALLALLSLRFVFPERLAIPSRDDPYFTNARLISGFTVPFALLYVRGLGAVARWIPRRAGGCIRASLLGLVVATMLISEAWLSAPAVRSEYNWFHLKSAAHGPCAATPPSRTGTSGARDAQAPAR
jgi:hypothetical protein